MLLTLVIVSSYQKVNSAVHVTNVSDPFFPDGKHSSGKVIMWRLKGQLLGYSEGWAWSTTGSKVEFLRRSVALCCSKR
jgi:hypothetical protein